MGDAIIGVTAAGNQRRDARAKAMNPGVRSERHDFPGDFQAEHVGHAGRRRVVALALMDVRSIDARGFHANQNLAFSRNRAGAHLNFQRLRTARAGRDHGAHPLALLSQLTLPFAGFRRQFVNRRSPRRSRHPPAGRRETREALRRGH